MARFTVKMRNVTIGWSELEVRDATTGAASGAFRPGPGYELVEPVFQLFAKPQANGPDESADHDRLARYHAARDRLGLSLHTLNGALIPTEVIHIVGAAGERGPDALELHVGITSSRAWRTLGGTTSASQDA